MLKTIRKKLNCGVFSFFQCMCPSKRPPFFFPGFPWMGLATWSFRRDVHVKTRWLYIYIWFFPTIARKANSTWLRSSGKSRSSQPKNSDGIIRSLFEEACNPTTQAPYHRDQIHKAPINHLVSMGNQGFLPSYKWRYEPLLAELLSGAVLHLSM